MRCDCGYDFETGIVEASFLSPQELATSGARAVSARTDAAAFATATLVVVTLLGLARLSGPTGPIGGATYAVALVGLIFGVAGSVLLVSKTRRADARLLVAVGLGAWVGLYAGLSVFL